LIVVLVTEKKVQKCNGEGVSRRAAIVDWVPALPRRDQDAQLKLGPAAQKERNAADRAANVKNGTVVWVADRVAGARSDWDNGGEDLAHAHGNATHSLIAFLRGAHSARTSENGVNHHVALLDKPNIVQNGVAARNAAVSPVLNGLRGRDNQRQVDNDLQDQALQLDQNDENVLAQAARVKAASSQLVNGERVPDHVAQTGHDAQRQIKQHVGIVHKPALLGERSAKLLHNRKTRALSPW
jgi:hypothetical protein